MDDPSESNLSVSRFLSHSQKDQVVTLNGRRLLPFKSEFLGHELDCMVPVERVPEICRRLREMKIDEETRRLRAEKLGGRVGIFSIGIGSLIGASGVSIGASSVFGIAAFSLIAASLIVFLLGWISCNWLENRSIEHNDQASRIAARLEDLS